MTMKSVSLRDASAKQQALDTLRSGGVLIFPTDTVYGVGGDATNGEVQKRVAHLKSRPPEKPFPWLVADMEMAGTLGEFSEEARELAKNRWPGQTTIVVLKKDGEPPRGAGRASPLRGGGTVGLRVPDHPWLRELIGAFGKPLIGTSANSSGKQPATSPDTVDIEADLLIDGGTCSGAPSEVIDLTGAEPTILRARP